MIHTSQAGELAEVLDMLVVQAQAQATTIALLLSKR
jgi:hypothetical protein